MQGSVKCCNTDRVRCTSVRGPGQSDHMDWQKIRVIQKAGSKMSLVTSLLTTCEICE
ncbi:unnamed protein product [Staurois parvus]|uniref:Uncharacterized protein n=1 Tax=Staurois parvus TaxID=386267 RepID=A0ABN9CYQ8_9NEOB|nr:unnamed protein product [Staurois parvus]